MSVAVLWYAFANGSGCNDAGRSAGSGPLTKGARHGGVRTGDVIRVSRRTSESVQELDVVRQFSLSGRLFRVKLGGTGGTEGADQ